MSETVSADQFDTLFRHDTPLLDVRAAVEFAQGAFATATNLPLLTDPERQQVGLTYRQTGREAAVKLGHELVTETTRETRVKGWQAFATSNPDALLYCYRGGLRSQLVQQWLQEAGVNIARIEGGYKALRRHLIRVVEQFDAQDKLVLVAGKTGSGKTHFINSLDTSVDLEKLANHRGSAFGKHVEPQPSQANFENALGIALLKCLAIERRRIAVEDESHAIGSLSVPKKFHLAMGQAPIAVIEENLDVRVQTIHMDYIQSNYQAFKVQHPDAAETLFTEFLLGALTRIKKRLGGERYQQLNTLMLEALRQQFQNRSTVAHETWIRELLQQYYDPMYDYQLGKKADRIVFRGSKAEVKAWIQPMLRTGDS